MKRTPESIEVWQKELQYLTDLKSLADFDGSLGCLLRYTAMQGRFCRMDGFENIARKIELTDDKWHLRKVK